MCMSSEAKATYVLSWRFAEDFLAFARSSSMIPNELIRSYKSVSKDSSREEADVSSAHKSFNWPILQNKAPHAVWVSLSYITIINESYRPQYLLLKGAENLRSKLSGPG